MTPKGSGFRTGNAAWMLAASLLIATWTAGAAPVIRSGAEPDYPPLCFVDQYGTASGFSVELLRETLRAMGREVSFGTAPWAELKQKLADGGLDVLPLAGRTPEREALYDFTVPWLTLHGALFVREDETAIHSLADLAGKRIAVMKGDNAEEYVLRENLSDQVIRTDTFEETFRMLADGKADAVIAQKLMGVTLLKNLRITNVRVAGKPNEEFKQDFCFAVSKGNSALLAILNEGLALTVQDGTQQRLKQKWLGTAFYETSLARPLIYGGDRAFPPYEYLDEDGQPAGFNIDLARALARELGVEISFRLEPWSEIRRKMDAGEIDMAAMFYSADRDRTADFSMPLTASAQAVFAGKNSPPYAGPDSLRGKRISVQNGDLAHDYLLKNGFASELVVTPTPQEALRMLANSEVDFSASALLQGRYWIEQNKWNHLRVVDKHLFVTDYCFAVPQGNPVLLGRINEGLTLLKESGEYRNIYNRWLGVLGSGMHWKQLRRLLIIIGSSLALTAAIVPWFFHLLRRQVRKKTAELRAANRELDAARAEALNRMQEAVRANEKLELNQFALDSSSDTVFWIAPDGHFTFVNQAACDQLGYNRDELLSMSVPDIDPDFPPERWPQQWQLMKENRSMRFESHHQTKDGQIFPTEIYANFISRGDKEYIFAFVHNISDRKEQQQALEKANARLKENNRELDESRRAALNIMEDAMLAKERLEITQFALDRSADAVFWVERDSSFSYVNNSACRLLEYTREELLKLSVPEIDPSSPPERVNKTFTELEQSGALDVESILITKDGSTVPVEIHDSLIRIGSRSFICAFIHDITNRKRLQEAIEKRILALTRPLEDNQEIAFNELFDLKEIQRIQDEFAAATGVASIITQTDGTPITQSSNFTSLCNDIIRKTEKGCSNCFRSDAALGQHNPGGPIIQPCLSGGLWDAGVSITVGGQHVANWLIGQVRDETQTDEHMRAYAREIGADETAFMNAFYRVPVMSREQFDKIARSLFTLANQLSTTAYLNMQQARFIADEERRTEEMRRLSTAIEQSPEAVVITNASGLIEYINPAFETITGYTREEAAGKTPRILKSGQHDSTFYSNLWKTIQSGQTWTGRFINKKKNGGLYTEEAFISPVKDPSGTISGYVAVKRDITRELEQEEQFRQGQKMEAVGQLAGGVAHDFNNILQAILGFSEILIEQLPKSGQEYRNAIEIDKAARRAAELTRQLLTFSRKQPVDRKLLNLNNTVRDAEVLFHMLLGEKTVCEFNFSSELPPVYADSSQIIQILMNLAVNSRDAMPDGGRLTISTEAVNITPHDVQENPEAQPGSFVCISVTDTGVGISPEVKARLFEPFFTTKSVGKGTGLGLAVVYGIIKQNKGWIRVDSEPGRETTFKIYLPARHPDDPLPARAGEGTGRILLVDDDTDTLNMILRILTSAGYRISVAASVEEALNLFRKNPDGIDLLFSDIILHGKNGIELANTLREEKPDLPVLLYSGYRDPHERWKEIDSKGYSFLQKPFSVTGMLAAVHDILAGPG